MKISLRDITIDYDNLRAIDDLSLEFHEGEIHALVGENGAGKSSLMSVLYGLNLNYSGKILFNDKEIFWSSPKDAIQHGIGMVHQHFMLIDELSVLENIILGYELDDALGFINFSKIQTEIKALLKLYDINLNLSELVTNLSVAQKQMVEIIKLLYRNAKVLILDEPTAVLTPNETELFFKTLRNFRLEKKIIILITHKIDEVMSISDHVSILRNGKLINSSKLKQTTKKKIEEQIVGKKLPKLNVRRGIIEEQKILEVNSLRLSTRFSHSQPIDLFIKQGEILGIAGVSGNGQNELIESILGVRKVLSGSIEYLQEDITHKSTRYRRIKGISFIPQDRRKDGLAIKSKVWENVITTNLSDQKFSIGPFVKKKSIKNYANQLINEYSIKVDNPNSSVLTMSGGNMQKLVVARELSNNFPLIIIENPTWGIDVGSIAFIHQKILDIKAKGAAILLVSNELDEIEVLADSAVVMYEGNISKRITKDIKFRENIASKMLSGVHFTENING